MSEVEIQIHAAAVVNMITDEATARANGDARVESAMLQQIAHATMERAQLLAKRADDDVRTFIEAKANEFAAHRTAEQSKRDALKAARAAIEK